MKKKLTFFSFFLFLSLAIIAQVKSPAKWVFSIEKKSATQYHIVAKATIEKGWHIYGLKKVDGPVPTSIEITAHPLVMVDGKPQEIGKKITKYEEIFSTQVDFFENTMTVILPIKLKAQAKLTITGTLKFMACDDENCTPPQKVPFSLSIQ